VFARQVRLERFGSRSPDRIVDQFQGDEPTAGLDESPLVFAQPAPELPAGILDDRPLPVTDQRRIVLTP